jgi:hypothetical protein
MDHDYAYTISHENSLVRVNSSGIFDYLKALKMWEEIVATCEEKECFLILFISNMAAPLPVAEAFDASEFFKATGITAKYRLAVVTEDPGLLESVRIADHSIPSSATPC